jgi:hypothetical protein
VVITGRSRKPLFSQETREFESHPLRSQNMFNLFKKTKKDPQDLKEVVDYLKELDKNFEKLSQELNNLKRESNFAVQKVGVVRFNPFSSVGSDQSFSVALLDKNDDGLVITSLFSREGNRVYAKPVKASQSDYLLSSEEKSAIEKAKNPKS